MDLSFILKNTNEMNRRLRKLFVNEWRKAEIVSKAFAKKWRGSDRRENASKALSGNPPAG
jgi:hypothetical protein